MFQNGACYIRVSTDDQTEYSPDAQLKALKNYAKQNNIILTKEHIYIDEGISGRKAEKRPKFMEMIATAKTKPKPFDVILVHKFDRFARSREDSVVYKSLLKRECGIKVISTTESIEDDKFSVILEAMLEAMAEYYSLNLSEEVKKGMTEKAERGQFQSCPPFGYKMQDKELVIVPNEADFVKSAFQKYGSGEMNMSQLTKYANNIGLKTHRGNVFETRSFEYMFNNPVYIGKVRWTPTEKAQRNYNHPDTIIKDSSHEPLITIEEWERVQKRIKDNKQIYRKREKPTSIKRSWLCGLVRCANCNHTLVVSNIKYFQCCGYSKSKCKISCSVPIKTIEALVLERLRDAFQGEIEINVVFNQSDLNLETDETLISASLEMLDKKEIRIKIAYQDGIDTLDEYKANKNHLTEERDMLLKELRIIKEKLIQIQPDNVEINHKLKSVYELLTDETIDTEDKYKTAHYIIDEIVFSKQENVLKMVYKM